MFLLYRLSDHEKYSVPWLWIAGPILLVITLLAIATTFFVWRRKGMLSIYYYQIDDG